MGGYRDQWSNTALEEGAEEDMDVTYLVFDTPETEGESYMEGDMES